VAKLKAPLLSFGASGAIAKALVYFGWKGLNVVREYVVPANPKTDPQTTQRDYLKDAVAAVHTAQALATHQLAEIDNSAYALLGSVQPTPRTWFNEVVRGWLKQNVASLKSSIFHGCAITSAATTITIELYFTDDGENHITEGDFWYGTSKTALNKSVAASMYDAPYLAIGDISGLSKSTKYFVQFRPTAHADFVGVRSGIYHDTTLAA